MGKKKHPDIRRSVNHDLEIGEFSGLIFQDGAKTNYKPL
jgi:hypothetical protein